MAKRSVKGLPKSVQSLAKAGERFRLPGTWLYDTERDRTIARWLDDMASHPEVNVSEMIKDFLYRQAIGHKDPDPVVEAINDLREQINAVPVPVLAAITQLREQLNRLKFHAGNNGGFTQDEQQAVDNAEEVINALLGFDD